MVIITDLVEVIVTFESPKIDVETRAQIIITNDLDDFEENNKIIILN